MAEAETFQVTDNDSSSYLEVFPDWKMALWLVMEATCVFGSVVTSWQRARVRE